VISLYGTHHDAEHFLYPETYDPYRFSEDSRNYNPTSFMPFGEGPRTCIAQRKGRVNVIKHFNVEVISKRLSPLVYLLPKDGIRVLLSKRDSPSF